MTTIESPAPRPLRWFTDAYFGPVPIAAAVLLAAAALAYAWTGFRGHTHYTDLVVGMVAWDDGNKPADTYAMLTLAAVGAAAALAFGRLFRRLAPGGPTSPVGAALTSLLLLSLAPAVWRLCAAAMQPSDTIPPVRFLAAFPLGVMAVAVALTRYRPGTVTPAHVLTCGGAALLTPIVAAFDVIGLAVAAVRIYGSAGAGDVIPFVAGHVGNAGTVVAGVAAAGVVATWVGSADIDGFRRRLLRGLVAWQLPLPLLLFYLLPPPLIDPLHRFATPRPTLLIAVLAVLAAAGTWTVARRLPRLRPPRAVVPLDGVGDGNITTDPAVVVRPARQPILTLAGAIAAATVVALLVYADAPSAGGAPGAPRDLFHWGEQVLPWQQLWQFHARPYVDFAPIHALMAYIRGGMNQLFFGGTAATYNPSTALLVGLICTATALAGVWLLGPVAALVLVFFPLTELDRVWLLAPAMYVVAAPRTWRRPAWGLVVWAAVALVGAAYNPSIGMAFAAASLPVALCLAAPAGPGRFALACLGIAAAAAIALAIPPVRQTLLGFVQFLRVNAASNTTANDIPWVEGAWNRGPDVAGLASTQLLWEATRFAWMLVAVVAAALAWRSAGRPRGQRPPGLLPMAVMVVLVLCIASPWTMGRIDIGAQSRPGGVSREALFLLLPALLLLARPTAATVAVIAVVGGLAYPSTNSALDPAFIVAKTVTTRFVQPTDVLVDGPAIGLPNLGQIIRPTPDWVDEVADLRRKLLSVLPPGQTFLDLTNEQALYFDMGMRMPVRYDSYVAANTAMQQNEERQLAAHPVSVVMIGPATKFDHAPESLRCYRLYRDYALRFTPVVAGPFTFLVEPSLADRFAVVRPLRDPARQSGFRPTAPPTPAELAAAAAAPAPTPAQLAEDRRLLLDECFHVDRPLQRLPIAWGHSWPTLAKRFDVVAAVGDTRGVPGHAFVAGHRRPPNRDHRGRGRLPAAAPPPRPGRPGRGQVRPPPAAAHALGRAGAVDHLAGRRRLLGPRRRPVRRRHRRPARPPRQLPPLAPLRPPADRPPLGRQPGHAQGLGGHLGHVPPPQGRRGRPGDGRRPVRPGFLPGFRARHRRHGPQGRPAAGRAGPRPRTRARPARRAHRARVNAQCGTTIAFGVTACCSAADTSRPARPTPPPAAAARGPAGRNRGR